MPHPADTSLRIAAAAAPLRAQIASRIRDAIASGRFAPGERLVERELCELLGVSRTSLREALRELESEGLVDSVPNRGMIVAVIDSRDAREIYEVREFCEALIARRFAEHATEAQRQALDGAVALLRSAYASREGLMAAKNGFYEALMAGADHGVAASILRTIQARASLLRQTTLADPTRAQASLAEIQQILAAIEARDGQAAFDAAAAHVRQAAAFALPLLDRGAALAGGRA